jgi:hypothetical protein
MLLLASSAVISCASSHAAAPEASSGAPAPERILAGCKERPLPSGAVRYDCQGFRAVEDDAPDGAGDPDGEVDELVAGVVQEFGPLREKLGARVRVEKSTLEVGGRETHAAKVSADDPARAGRTFAAGYVIVSGHRRLVCTTQAGGGQMGDGQESCGPAMRLLLDRGGR